MTPKTRIFVPNALRKKVLDTAYAGLTVHFGRAFSIIDLLVVLYRNHLRYPANDPLVNSGEIRRNSGKVGST